LFAEELEKRIRGICSLSPEQIKKLEAHYELLLRWNKIINLTAIRDEAEIVERHYCESLFLGSRLPEGPLHIADIGSGAGFPGFPVAVLRADCKVTLIESHQRKAAFLKEAARDTENVRVLAKRAEEVEARFHWVISRAVRYEDIAPAVRLLGPNVALLAGEKTGSSIQLPWGNHRYLTFHVKP
jgi:16S rRNA (guanine(527)-N(7))-methyltransferase RsmG